MDKIENTEKNLVIIDGYNMINKWKEWRKLLENGEKGDLRMKFIEKIRVYTKRFPNLEALVIFDGKIQKKFEWDKDKVKVIFSGENTSADDRIIEFYMNYKDRYKKIIVITEDKKVFNKIESLGGISIRSNDLRKKLELTPSKSIAKNLAIKINPNKRENRINLLNQL
ncbi:MAG TPA: hypothetical protein ENN73_05105 [Firmicutes bacterium]|nr:hypothetical protein [Bacillota bacterium]